MTSTEHPEGRADAPSAPGWSALDHRVEATADGGTAPEDSTVGATPRRSEPTGGQRNAPPHALQSGDLQSGEMTRRRTWPWLVVMAAITVAALALLSVQWFNHTFPVTEDAAAPGADAQLAEATTLGASNEPADPDGVRSSIVAAFDAALDPATEGADWAAVVHGDEALAARLRLAQQRCPDVTVEVGEVTFSTPQFAQVGVLVAGGEAFGWAESVDGDWLMTGPSVAQIADSIDQACAGD